MLTAEPDNLLCMSTPTDVHKWVLYSLAPAPDDFPPVEESQTAPKRADWCILPQAGGPKMEIPDKGCLLRFSAVVWAILIAPLAARGDLITGGAGSSKSDNGPNGGRDDTNVSTTLNASYQTYCSWLIYGMQNQFAGVNFTFAGSGSNIGDLFSQVPSSDFKVSQYKPWVDNNTSSTNNVVNPTGFSDYRGVTNQDAGGADILLTYTPRANSSDPTIVNFVQAYVDDINNTGFASGRIDNLGAPSPFYNYLGTAGTGTTQITRPVSNTPGKGLNAQGSNAWLVDIPYKCESFIPRLDGTPPPGSNANCSGGPAPPNDEILTSSEVAFQTFIESTQTIYYNQDLATPYSLTNNGGEAQTWDVLYGGVQWGFSYTNADPPNPQPIVPPPPAAAPAPAPEPSGILLMGTALAAGLLTKIPIRRKSSLIDFVTGAIERARQR